MNIATYNLRFGGKQRTHWKKMLEEHSVDILLLQETYPSDEHLKPLFYPPPGERCVFQCVPGRSWGSAVYVTNGCVRRIVVPDFEGWVEGGEITGVTWPDGGSDGLLTFSLHAPSVEDSYANQVNKILDQLMVIASGRPMILGGDFNLSVSHGDGSLRPTSKHELAIHKRIADELQLINCWKEYHPTEPLHQTLRWSRDKTAVYHCDGLFVPTSWKNKLAKCEVLSGLEWNDLSDHNPVWAAFN